jgi:hypothetical protein
LDAKDLLSFIDAQSGKERAYFDRLLKWLVGMVGVIVAVFGYFGYQNLQEVRRVGDQIREETKKQLSAAVSEELTKDKIQDEIAKALQSKTDVQFQDAINKAVAVELDTPGRQNFLEAATKREVKVVTKRLQDRDKIFTLGDAAIGRTATSGPALRELRRLSKTDPDEAIKNAALAQIERAAGFWGTASYLELSYEITTFNGKPVKQAELTTCDLLVLLRSNSWQDRARSADLLLGHAEKGVPEALIHALSDDYVEVSKHARNSLELITSNLFYETLPDLDEVDKTWATKGAAITANLKPAPSCR